MNEVIQEVLEKLQTKGDAFVVGGYVRDTFLGVEAQDIDIACEMTLEAITPLFRGFFATEQGKAMGVGRFRYRNHSFEVSTYGKGEFLSTLGERDFVCNAMYDDGEKVHDPFGAKASLQKRMITPLAPPSLHFKTHPQAYLRALRFSSRYGFTLDPSLETFMTENPVYFTKNTDNRIQEEGYKILSSAYPLLSVYYLQQFGLLPKEHSFDPLRAFPAGLPLSVTCAYMASFIGKSVMEAWLYTFLLSKKVIERFHLLSPYIEGEDIPHHPSLLNEVFLLKKQLYQHQPDKWELFLSAIRKK